MSAAYTPNDSAARERRDANSVRVAAAIGRPVQAMIAVRVRPPTRANIEAFREWSISLPETLDVFVTSGTEDFLLLVGVPNNEALYSFVIDRLTERPELVDVRTSVVYEHLHNHNIAPLA